MIKKKQTLDAKSAVLASAQEDDTGEFVTTDQGLRINDDQDGKTDFRGIY